MEKVIVKKNVPGLLDKGDVLVKKGTDFIYFDNWENTEAWEKFVCLDEITVYDNMPDIFEFIVEEGIEYEVEEVKPVALDVVRTPEEIAERYEFYKNRLDYPFFNGTEGKVVYQNLMWFIDWLTGQRDLLK